MRPFHVYLAWTITIAVCLGATIAFGAECPGKTLDEVIVINDKSGWSTANMPMDMVARFWEHYDALDLQADDNAKGGGRIAFLDHSPRVVVSLNPDADGWVITAFGDINGCYVGYQAWHEEQFKALVSK